MQKGTDGARAIVVVPTFNERENLPILIGRLLSIPSLSVLVVDDGSPDGTGKLADELAAADARVSVLHRTGPHGLGRAYVEGLQQALQTEAEFICQMDADLSHRPEDLAAMLVAARHCDLVIGSRYVPGGRIVNWPFRRRILSAGANSYIRRICGIQVRDCTSGLRCWRRQTLETVALTRIASEGYAFLVELLHRALTGGCRVAEVPITFVEREHGASKLRFRVLVESALLPWRLAFAAEEAGAPSAAFGPASDLTAASTYAPRA